MARKQLIRGANAEKVEDRIARIPEDIREASGIFHALKEMETRERPPSGADRKPLLPKRTRAAKAEPEVKPSAAIAPLIKSPSAAVEKKASVSSKPAKPAARASTAEASTLESGKAALANERSAKKKPLTRLTARAKKAIPAPVTAAPVTAAREAAPPTSSSETPSTERKTKARVSIELTSAERKVIARCCRDYRNRLPIYLKSAWKEAEIIDAIIGKCGE